MPATIDRVRIEALATAEFIGRRENLVLVGQSGVGKSRIIQAIGQSACVLGYRVRYTTSADVLADLTASLADQTLPRRLREYAHFDLLIIDEFGFDRIERSEARQAASLLYKLIDAAEPEAIDGVGDEHRLRGVGRLPGRSAAGDGVSGPDRGRCDHREDQRQVVPSPPGAAGVPGHAVRAIGPQPEPESAVIAGSGSRLLTTPLTSRSRPWSLAYAFPSGSGPCFVTTPPNQFPKAPHHRSLGNHPGGSILAAKVAQFLTAIDTRRATHRLPPNTAIFTVPVFTLGDRPGSITQSMACDDLETMRSLVTTRARPNEKPAESRANSVLLQSYAQPGTGIYEENLLT